MLSSTGNDVESGANGFRVSRGDSVAENDGGNPQDEGVNHDQTSSSSSSVRLSSAVQHSGKSTSQDHDDPLSPSAVHGSTPLSQIGAHGCAPVNDMYLGQGESPLYRRLCLFRRKPRELFFPVLAAGNNYALAILLILRRVKVCAVIYFRVSSIFAATSDSICSCNIFCDLHKSLTS